MNRIRGLLEHAGRPANTSIGVPAGKVVTLGMITDGTSNTVLAGEKAYSKLAKDNFNSAGVNEWWGPNWWTAGTMGDGGHRATLPAELLQVDETAANAVPNKVPRGE